MMTSEELDTRAKSLAGRVVRGLTVVGTDTDGPAEPRLLTGILQVRYVRTLHYYRCSIKWGRH
jgi:hypothetical protein